MCVCDCVCACVTVCVCLRACVCVSLYVCRSAIVAGRKCVQGNLDPITLFAPEAVVSSRVKAMIDGFSSCPLIANLGHGMMPSHNPTLLRTFLDGVHTHSARTK
ncbi:MAG: uroporphyrinogen decarboxylase family protein [Terracidiphilus sp.]|nr:uroporphyrinogen decarboxylase family protein [Terracidiphilus sp.]